jgi:hypothetical protein
MTVRAPAHERIMKYNGERRIVRVSEARKWAAEDYDLIEELIEKRLRYAEMLPYFTDPPVTLDALKSAVYEAKIPYPYHTAGRPRKDKK